MPLVIDGRFDADRDWQPLAAADAASNGASGIIDYPGEVAYRRGADPCSATFGVVLTADVDLSLQPIPNACVQLVVIEFNDLSDGRGFSLARRLRRQGWAGTLRARGPLLPDQYPELLSCGFDQVEITPAHAMRHPEQRWLAARQLFSPRYQVPHTSGQTSGLYPSIMALRGETRSAEIPPNKARHA